MGLATHALDLQELSEDARDDAQIGNALRHRRRDTQEFHSGLHSALGVLLEVLADTCDVWWLAAQEPISCSRGVFAYGSGSLVGRPSACFPLLRGSS